MESWFFILRKFCRLKNVPFLCLPRILLTRKCGQKQTWFPSLTMWVGGKGQRSCSRRSRCWVFCRIFLIRFDPENHPLMPSVLTLPSWCHSFDDQVYGTPAAGDADELRLLSINGTYINLRAYGGSLDFLSTKVGLVCTWSRWPGSLWSCWGHKSI